MKYGTVQNRQLSLLSPLCSSLEDLELAIALSNTEEAKNQTVLLQSVDAECLVQFTKLRKLALTQKASIGDPLPMMSASSVRALSVLTALQSLTLGFDQTELSPSIVNALLPFTSLTEL